MFNLLRVSVDIYAALSGLILHFPERIIVRNSYSKIF